jgi:serine O-acetyltransferase
MIDHGTGVVIGETAVVGKNCSFLHGVTLGSTGKDKGDRHPKIGHDVLIGCGVTILGNISIGHCCKIGSGSIVLKPLPFCSTAVGNPARIVGRSMCRSSARGMDLALKYVVRADGSMFDNSLEASEEEKWIEQLQASLSSSSL